MTHLQINSNLGLANPKSQNDLHRRCMQNLQEGGHGNLYHQQDLSNREFYLLTKIAFTIMYNVFNTGNDLVLDHIRDQGLDHLHTQIHLGNTKSAQDIGNIRRFGTS